jgi:hypothetical protein
MKKNKIFFLILLGIFIFFENSFADSTNVSFQSLNKKKKYTSISFGMGAVYGDNRSLKNFIQYEIPNYSFLTRDEQLSEFYTGLDFFGGVEKQISKIFSAKLEYSFFIKSYNVKLYPQYDFSYVNHQPGISVFYLIPQEYSFIKIGIGGNYIYSKLNVKEFGTEKSYTSSGLGLKTEIILNTQIGKSFAGYISGYLTKSFLSNLKDDSGKQLTGATGETVNLNSFGAGIRLGVEVFIF